MKKALCLLFVLLFVFTLCSCNPTPTEGLKYEFKEEYGTYTVYIGENRAHEKIVIPSKYNDKLVTEIGSYAFSMCENLTEIVIPDSVVIIGQRAFEGCDKLKSITLPDDLSHIGAGAFADCTSLKEIKIPKNVYKIDMHAFLGCSMLEKIEVDSDNNYFSSSDGILFNKDKTQIVRYLQAKTSTEYIVPNNVTSIEKGAFTRCSNLEKITISTNVKSIGWDAFAGCTNLTITYQGTKAQWNEIFTKTDSKALTVHCTDGDIRY